MVTIDQATQTEEDPLEGAVTTEPDPEQDSIPQGEPPKPQESPFNQVLEVIKKPTGPGPIEDYIDHPLNYDNSKTTAQILRGLTGLLGDLKFALIDIAFGVGQKFIKRRGGTK